MKVPYRWLKEWVDLVASPEDIRDKLTFSGIEVEGITVCGGVPKGVVAGKIEEVRPHPNADRLRLCTVFDGEQRYPVVCGAPNVADGMIAAFAPSGVELPGGGKLKKTKIRGEVSEGMLCAEDELGLSEDHEGILELSPEVEPGTELSAIYGEPDTVFELEITWNRPDCLSVIGIARELAALYEKPMKKPMVGAVAGEGTAGFRVAVDDGCGCLRYTGRRIRNIQVKPSPRWMQDRLRCAGIRPINNVVDITNYVLLEYGQPLHAFDADKLRGDVIGVRGASPEEVLQTLDGQSRELEAGMLVITDAGGPIALAGVMGGAESEISESTTHVLLESACFDAVRTRRTSAVLHLSSESSHRYERGVDPELALKASDRAIELLCEFADGIPDGDVVDCYPAPRLPSSVILTEAKLNRTLGVNVAPDVVEKILGALEFEVTCDPTQGGWQVTAPTFRFDIEREADLIEEIARMYGLEHIPSQLPDVRVVPDVDDSPSRAVYRCREIIAGLGFCEAMSYSFLASSFLQSLSPELLANTVRLPNPVSADHDVMRPSLLPQMIESLSRNQARQCSQASLFETGTVFEQSENSGVAERSMLAVGLLGVCDPDVLKRRQGSSEETVFLTLKGAVETALAAMNCPEPVYRPIAHCLFEQGGALELLLDGRSSGVIGLLRRDLRSDRRMVEPVALAELNLGELCASVFDYHSYVEVPSYPAVSRDIAMLVSQSVSHQELVEIIKRAAPAELTGISLFDIFQGEGIEQGKKSVGYSLTYQAADRTLTDDETNRLHDAVKSSLQKEAGAILRE